jgi:hypothetical protein
VDFKIIDDLIAFSTSPGIIPFGFFDVIVGGKFTFFAIMNQSPIDFKLFTLPFIPVQVELNRKRTGHLKMN